MVVPLSGEFHRRRSFPGGNVGFQVLRQDLRLGPVGNQFTLPRN